MRVVRRCVGVVLFCAIGGGAWGQTAPPAGQNVPFRLDAEPVGRAGDRPEVVLPAAIGVRDALRLRRTFDEVRLSGNHLGRTGFCLRITPPLDVLAFENTCNERCP